MKDDAFDGEPDGGEGRGSAQSRSFDASGDESRPVESASDAPTTVTFDPDEPQRSALGAGSESAASADEPQADDEDDSADDQPVQSGGAEDGLTGDDPLSPGFDLDSGESFRSSSQDKHRSDQWRNKIGSPKEFFATEILYRFDIMEPQTQGEIAGNYRLELKGNKGGVWTINVAEQVNVLNSREEAEVVLSMQQSDFLRIINGELNPQLAILAQKVKVSGDIRKAVAFQTLLAPTVE